MKDSNLVQELYILTWSRGATTSDAARGAFNLVEENYELQLSLRRF